MWLLAAGPLSRYSQAMRVLMMFIAPILVGIAAYFTFVDGYSEPNSFFWDENYHVSAAQKYLNHVFFMESHPPLGKLFIALGEELLHANEDNSQFINTDYAKNPKDGFSFKGYRLFPVIFAWLTALFVYALLYELTKSPLRSLLLSSLYLFENALIVHSRGAMLDSIQLCFLVAMIYFVVRIRNGAHQRITYLLTGIAFAAALNTKANAILLSPFLLLPFFSIKGAAGIRRYLCMFIIGAAITTIAVWAEAFSLAQVVNKKLEHQGWYAATPELRDRVTANDRSFGTLVRFVADSLTYSESYHSKVPKLNFCKADENGSYPLLWPLGARSINYRWEKKDGLVKYLYLQANPLNWTVALVGLLAAFATLASRFLGERVRRWKNEDLIILFSGSYLLYMAATLSVDRVFYLYHYFVPLIFCFALFALVLEEVPKIGGLAITTAGRDFLAGLVALLSFLTFLQYKPLTYYQPISAAEVNRLRLLRIWDLVPIDTEKTNPLARPINKKEGSQPQNEKWTLELDGLKSLMVTQSWGTPTTGRTVDGEPLIIAGARFEKGFGVHASSRIDFPVAQRFKRFTAKVGIPDEVLDTNAAVKFKVVGDGKTLWESPVMHAGDPALPVDIPIEESNIISLTVGPAEDAVDNDHACWVDPQLVP